jgi:CspA family cold shock protein
MATGKVKTMMRDRGFGFIQLENGGQDVFFHSSAMVEGAYDGLNEGDKVEFDIEPDPRNASRKQAANVRVTP